MNINEKTFEPICDINVIKNYEKKVTVTRLKEAYTILSEAVLMSIKDNEAIEYWDFDISTQDFMNKYIKPYINDVGKTNKNKELGYSNKSDTVVLANGQVIQGVIYKNPKVLPYFNIIIDINGDKKPNQKGRDIFSFFIFSKKASSANTGLGDCARNIPRGGLYPDGYGYNREILLNSSWRGCNTRKKNEGKSPSGGNDTSSGSFCTALIMIDNWEIAKDYLW